MEIKISSLDPTGVSDEIFSTDIPIKYFRFLVEIDGVKYMLTKFVVNTILTIGIFMPKVVHIHSNTYNKI